LAQRRCHSSALFAPDDASTSVVLVATHLVAAAVLIPVLARHLRTTSP